MNSKGFTLIELLIVVAIIAILAAIAVPNFLEAQTRSKVSRVKADLRTLATAMEAYQVDNNILPPNDGGGVASQFRLNKVVVLTTPIAYITSLPEDPFFPSDAPTAGANLDAFQYFNYDYRFQDTAVKNLYGIPIITASWGWQVRNAGGVFDIKGGVMKSWGPDTGQSFPGTGVGGDSGVEWAAFGLDEVTAGFPGIVRFYDPTNGTVSAGDIARFVGEVGLPQQFN